MTDVIARRHGPRAVRAGMLGLAAAAVLATSPGLAQSPDTKAARAAVSREAFLVRNTGDLALLCSVGQADPMRVQALHFCHGYVVGAYHYHLSARPSGIAEPFCVPPDTVNRDQAIAMFVDWVEARPDEAARWPTDSLFAFARETWPCAPSAAATPTQTDAPPPAPPVRRSAAPARPAPR